MSKIIPHLWYDKEAKEAVHFYLNLFDNSEIKNTTIIKDTPSGDSEIINFVLAGQDFAAISAGPYFKFNPSISLMVYCETFEEIDRKWEVLSEGGIELMPLMEYPFSEKYGWVQDKYGLSWQLMYNTDKTSIQKIIPNLLFSNVVCGKTEEALSYYIQIFKNSKIDFLSRYTEGESNNKNARINYSSFKLYDYNFSAMDNAFEVDFTFNEAFSFILNCDSQEEIDYYWERLSTVPEAEQCGWLKDKYGVSWQIVPSNMNDIMFNSSEDELKRVTETFLKMKKFDINKLESAKKGI